MATIQAKISRGYKYWYIVESRRVNGKPRPVVLAYLGTAENLLERLKGISDNVAVKSYSHGDVTALLKIAHKLGIATIINKYICSDRLYFKRKPIRNNLTAGFTYILGAIGRVCMLTSKRGWYQWAKTTSLEYLLRSNFSKLDSQHFWDLMDAMPEENIIKAEEEIIKRVFDQYQLKSDTLFYDTTNFYTYIATTNEICTIAQRGKNKQKRTDLRQFGMALIVTRQDLIPLYHHTYQGNMNDTKTFKNLIINIIERISILGLSLDNHTFVFDRGNNSKRNLALVKQLNIFYLGALTPYHHKELIETAAKDFQKIKINNREIDYYRDKVEIWGEQRTIIVFISDRLKQGQIRGLYRDLEKSEKKIQDLQNNISKQDAKKRNRKQLEQQINNILKDKTINRLIKYDVNWVSKGRYKVNYHVNKNELERIEDHFGFRIIMTNRHNWETETIIKSYYGQSHVEEVFKRLKNNYHLPVRPQFHWTNQKIRVHNFICIIGYLLTALIWRELKHTIQFQGSINTLCNLLKNIRLASIIERNNKNKRLKVTYKLEEMSQEEKQVFKALELENFHIERPKFDNFSVYT
jgi:transposase